LGRRSLLLAGLTLPVVARADGKRFLIGFANWTEDPAVRLEGLGFTGAEVRNGMALGARTHPVNLVFFDNDRDRGKTLANVKQAIERRVDLYIHYGADALANAELAQQLAAAKIPVLALIHPIPGAPLYAPDHAAAGRIAGEALIRFARAHWKDKTVLAVILGATADRPNRAAERADGVEAGLKAAGTAPAMQRLDTGGDAGRAAGLVGKALAGNIDKKLLIATLDDAHALAAKAAVESAGRLADAVIASQGCDRSVHGSISEKKEIDPANRGSIVLGSVGYYLDRCGYELIPLALRMLAGEKVPARSMPRHLLITAANVFREYPPLDMN
jgi:ABC-type sugar transport system substrate-binding protein